MEIKQWFWINREVNLESIWVTHKTWYGEKKKRRKKERGRKWCMVLNYFPCVTLWHSKLSAVQWMLWFFLYVLQVWLLCLSEYASSTLSLRPPGSGVFPGQRTVMVVICSQDAPFSPVCVIRTFILACAASTVACAGECVGGLHLLRCPMPCHSDLPWTYLMLAPSSRRDFQTNHLANWLPFKPGLKKMQATSIYLQHAKSRVANVFRRNEQTKSSTCWTCAYHSVP